MVRLPPDPDSETATTAEPSCCSRRAVLGGLAATGAALPVRGSAAGTRPPGQTARPDGPLDDPGALESFLDGVLEAQLETHDVAGATVSVVDGEEAFAKGYGYSDVTDREEVSAEETLFRIGSCSKLFTWTAVMQRIEEDRLDFGVDVNRYLDDVEIPATYGEPITLDHLATHTAGFEDRFRGTFVTDAESLRALKTVLREEQPARVRPPGRFTAYSNYGTGLAAHLAAKAAGTSFSRAVRESILEPLGMERTTFAQPVPEGLRADLSGGYTHDGTDFREGAFEYVGMPPVGAVSTTATDMAKFMRAHLRDGATDEGRILEPDSAAAMRQRRFGNDERLNGMCFGFYETSRNGVRAVGHGGDTELFHSLLFLLPEHDVGVFVSYNSPGGVAAREAFVDAFFENYYPTERTTPTVPDARPSRASDLEGTYRSLRMPYTTSEKVLGATGTIDVSVDDRGRIVTSPLVGETKRWVETDPLYFEEIDGADALAFRETDGEITHLFFDSRPASALERIPPQERSVVHGGVLALSVLVFLSALLGWPARAAWQRYRGHTDPGPPAAGYGRWVAGAAAASYLAFVVAFVVLLATSPLALFGGDPLLLRSLLVLPAVGALAAVASVGFTALAWRDRYWCRWSRIHYTLVALAAVAVTLVFGYWNLLWYRM